MAKIEPTCPQYEYIFSDEPFPAMVAGFGAGKSEAAVCRSILGKLKYPKQNRGFYEPTYDLIRMIAFPRFEEVLERLGLPYRLYKTPHNRLDIEGHGSIYFRSMDVPSRIIGYEHADADIDELDTLKEADAEEVWRRVLSRNRQPKPDNSLNTIGVTTTPEGFKFVYKTWGKDPSDGYQIIKAATQSNPHLPATYVPSLQAMYPDNLLAAYLNGDFVNLASGTVYASFDRTKNDSDETIKPATKYERGETLYVGVDFNVENCSAIVLVRRDSGFVAAMEHLGVFDTPSLAGLLNERYDGHKIVVYPDASGGSRKSVNASTSDLAVLQQAGFEVRAHSKNPFVKDRVMAVNSAYDHGNLRINVSKCPELARCQEQQCYNKAGEPDKDGGLDHPNDALGYPIAYEMPIRKPVAHIPVSFAV